MMQTETITASNGRGAPERALMHALLEDAIGCLSGRLGPERERDTLMIEAREWIENCDRRWPFSFENVCEELGLDIATLRTRLMRDMAEAAPAPVRRPVQIRAESARLANEDAVAEMIRNRTPLRTVAERFGISISKVSVLSRGLASRIKAERDTQIRDLRREGLTYRALAARFGLSRIRVMRICTRPERIAVDVRRSAAA